MKNSIISILLRVAVLIFAGCSTTNLAVKNPAHPTESAISNKVKMYFVYKYNCPACKMMKEHMKNKEISKLLQSEFDITMINMRQKDKLPKAWMRPYLSPTIYFTDQNNNRLIPEIHSMSAVDFLRHLEKAVKARNKQL